MQRLLPAIVALVLTPAFGIALAAPAPAPQFEPVAYYKLRLEAQQFIAQKDYARAATAYGLLTTQYPGDSATWMNLGGCLGRLEKWADAAAAYRHAEALGGRTHAELAHEIAGCWARAGKPDSAFVWLERAIALGYEERPELLEQDDFASLRGTERFQHAAGAAPKNTSSRDAGWRSDLDYLVGEIKRLHYVYRATPLPAGFDAGVRELRDRIPSLSDAGVMLAMQRLMAQLGDGHSTLYPVPGTRVTLRQIPLQFRQFSDGLFVADAPEGLERWIGVRVERVGTTPVAEVLARLAPYVSRDNSQWLVAMTPYFLRISTLLRELGITADENGVLLAGVAPSGERVEGVIPAAEQTPGGHPHPAKLGPARFAGAPPAARYLQRVQEHYWYEASPADSLVYVQFNQVIDMPDVPLRQFALDLRKELDTAPVRTVVVDLRHNNGGNSDLLVAPLRTLIRYETNGPRRRLFVLTSPQTFSAAQIFVAQLDRLTNAVFVGEPSGSRPNFVGEDTSLRLPWSGLRGSVSSRTHRVSSADERMWIAPEMPVPATGADWLAGRDAAMDAVLRLVRGQ